MNEEITKNKSLFSVKIVLDIWSTLCAYFVLFIVFSSSFMSVKVGLPEGSLSQHFWISRMYLLSHPSTSFGTSGLKGGTCRFLIFTKTSTERLSKNVEMDM